MVSSEKSRGDEQQTNKRCSVSKLVIPKEEAHVQINPDINSESSVTVIVDENGQVVEQGDGADIELIEEDTIGQIIQGDNGEYFVLVDESAPDIEIDRLNNVQVLVNDDGTETLVLEKDQEFIDNGGNISHSRTVLAETEDGTYEVVQLDDGEIEDRIKSITDTLPEDTVTTADTTGMESLFQLDDNFGPVPQGMKLRRNRVYGSCRCPECGQSFVNTARLERHLAVHQVFGSFLCPLCSKTYKYEYNLFYHWRRTCRDLNELVPIEDRRNMDVNALRQLVENVAQKKSEMTPVEIGINRNMLFATSPLARLEMPATSASRGKPCRLCGVIILSSHMDRHLTIHRGEAIANERAACGGYYCDLCGLLFRRYSNLIKHWRTGCPEIQQNLPEDQEIVLDDEGLLQMIMNLMKRYSDKSEGDNQNNSAVVSDITSNSQRDEKPTLVQTDEDSAVSLNTESHPEVGTSTADDATDDIKSDHLMSSHERINLASSVSTNASSNIGNSTCVTELPYAQNDRNVDVKSVQGSQAVECNNRWTKEEDVVFADDFGDDEEAVVICEEGSVGSLGSHFRSKWSLHGGPVSCPECCRSFANAGRLERHLAGFHASFGSHHCILCGNRFKYDYNLLYHYRRSCPYTKAFIDLSLRESIDATSLRKLVRTLSTKECTLNSSFALQARFPNHRQLVRYPAPVNKPPPHLLVPRPGLHDGKSCPICSIIFYGIDAIERHMKAAHPVEYDEWNWSSENNSNIIIDHDGRRILLQDFTEEADNAEQEETDPPPTLTAEQPAEQPNIVSDKVAVTVRRQHHIIEDEDGTERLVDDDGIEYNDGDGQEIEVHVDDIADVQRLIDTGQLHVRHGDQIILVQSDGLDDLGNEISDEQIIQESGATRIYTATEGFEVRRDRISTVLEQKDTDGSQTTQKESQKKQNTQQASDEGLEVAAILSGMKENETIHNESPKKSLATEAHCSGGPVVDAQKQPIPSADQQVINDDEVASTSLCAGSENKVTRAGCLNQAQQTFSKDHYSETFSVISNSVSLEVKKRPSNTDISSQEDHFSSTKRQRTSAGHSGTHSAAEHCRSSALL
ncbi:hypothetical protein AB6A40_002676 [Gnathostoma spinigerum]|uniref:C2H2-type domain-containing protein n=1 Tax=Gnathostoma spinigerum TaxID=75299 RepID=A0ABD6EHD1_9BILA